MKLLNFPNDPNEAFNWNTQFSFHSMQRSQQRGITKIMIYLAMDYSIIFLKQGLIFYAVKEKLLPETMDHHLREKLKNLVVVVSPESNEILTCYRSSNGIHHIKRKSKRLAA